jgi:hypothetical protein
MQIVSYMLMGEIKVQMSCKGNWRNDIVISTPVRPLDPETEYPYRFFMVPPILRKNAVIML